MAPRIKRGWHFNSANLAAPRLEAVYDGVKIFDMDANDIAFAHAAQFAGALGATGVLTATDELRIANGKNLRIGTIGAFVTTEPTNAVVMFQGTAFAGAITTAAGIQSNGTVLRKIIADGTVSNVG